MKGGKKGRDTSVWNKLGAIATVLIACTAVLSYAGITLEDLRNAGEKLIERLETEFRDSSEVWLGAAKVDLENWKENSVTDATELESNRLRVTVLSARAIDLNTSGRNWFSEMQSVKSSGMHSRDRPIQLRLDYVEAKRLDSLLSSIRTRVTNDIDTQHIDPYDGKRLLNEVDRARRLNRGTISDLSKTIEAWPVPVSTNATPSVPHDAARPERISPVMRSDSSTTYKWQLPPIYEPPFLDPKENGYEWSKHILPPLKEE